MEYRVAVCDDDEAQREYIKNLVRAWCERADVTARVRTFPSAQALLFDDSAEFDIFLLDVEMPGMSGVELAKTLRAQHETAIIVFITGYAEYIAEGYDVSALHYLMKPIDTQKLFAVLDKARNVLGKQELCLVIEVGGETLRVPLREIRYLEVSGNYVTVHAADTITVKKSLSELNAQLDDRFVRTGRSFIVNLSFIRRVTKTDVLLAGGEQIPLSRGMYDAVNRAIIERM